MPDFERWLDWELGLFQLARAFWRKFSPEPVVAAPEGAVPFAALEGRLQPFASLIAGRPVKLVGSARGGGVRADALLLPEHLAVTADPAQNTLAWLLRVAVDATTLSLAPPVPREAEAVAAASQAAARASHAHLCAALPGFAAAWAEIAIHLPEDGLGPSSSLYGRLLRLEGGSAGDGAGEAAAPKPRPTTEAEAPTPEDVTILQLAEQRSIETPIHSYEKVETVESFNGTLRQLDGEDELDEHLEALQSVQLSHLMRGGPEAHSMLRADVALDADIPDVASVRDDEPFVPYPEWDHRTAAYRPGWCRVYPTPIRALPNAWAADAKRRLEPTVREVHRRLDALRAARAPRPRQLDGDELDLDAMVAAKGDLAAGHTPDPRWFASRRRAERGLAVCVLLDLSLSADAYVDGRRVLDVARDAVYALGEASDRLGDRPEILGFASMTRNRVRVYTVRERDEPWSVGVQRLGSLAPVGYTRLGPALRHATARLSATPAERRALLLVSDGRPTDYDRYEGRYGVADVRRALIEARAAAVHVHALTIDHTAKAHVAHMFGPGSWELLPEPNRLPNALARLIAGLG
jgi:nitric oxide reductase NorD protein